MADNRRQSSSEQYVKKSNRMLLFFGLFVLLGALIGLGFMSGNQQQRDVETNIEYGQDDSLSGGQSSVTEGDIFARGNAQLRIDPAVVDMNNVVIGSNVEAVVSLRAENTGIRISSISFAEEQTDGFTIKTNCPLEETALGVDKTCSVTIGWNPVALRQLQNNLVIRWKEDAAGAYREETSTILVKGQSTDSKDCVICENVVKEKAEPKMAMTPGGDLIPIGPDDEIVYKGNRIKPIGDVYIDPETGEIIAIKEPDYIALNMNNEVMGTISDTSEVIGADGEVFGKLLGNKTIVDTKLTVLGAAVPVVAIIDAQGTVVGKATKEGTVVDGQGKVIGKVWVDGQAYSLEDKPIGYVRPWGLVADFMGKVIGAINVDGTVFDTKNNILGRIMPNGFAISNQGDLIGATIPQGVGVGVGCQALGKVLFNGEVKDGFDQTVGRVMLDGAIVNTEGEELGTVIPMGLVINEKGTVVGFVNSEGKTVNDKGAVIGCVNPDGSVSAGRKVVGAVMARGHVIGYGCQSIGSVFPNGEVFDNTLKSVGHVMIDGYVKSVENKVIGVVVTRGAAIADGCRLLGLISLTGQVLDMKNQPIGCMTPERTVINSEGEVIGSVAMNGSVYSSDAVLLGRVNYDGKVRDKDGNVIGCVNTDGSVTDLGGKQIGRVPRKGARRIGNKVYNEQGQAIGTVNEGNVVVNSKGGYEGFIPEDGHIFSPEGLILGRYSSQIGYAVNQNNERFAKVLFDMTVVSGTTGEIVGGLIPDNTGFIDKNGKYVGMVQLDGTLRDSKGVVIGAIRGDGTVVDKDGQVVAYRIIKGNVADSTGTIIGRVDSKGAVLSDGGTQIGYILGNGLAVSLDGKKLLGGVVPMAALAMDARGLVGYLNDNSRVLGLDGEYVGKATPFGVVLADDGTVVAKLMRLGVFTDSVGKTVGWTSLKGMFVGKDEKVIGKINVNGLAFDRSNKVVGSMVQFGTAIDTNGSYLSTVAVNNRLLKKDKQLALLTASPFIYGSDNIPLGRILPVGIGISNDGELLGWTQTNGLIGFNEDAKGRVLFDNRIINDKGKIIGQYVSLDSVAYGADSRTLGVVGLVGDIKTNNGQTRGEIRSGNYVVRDGIVVGRLLDNVAYVSNNTTGRANGLAQLTGEVVTTNGKPIGSLSLSGSVVNAGLHVLGHKTLYGGAVSNAMKTLGQVYKNGQVVSRNKTEGVISGTKTVYDTQGKIIGSILPSGVIIGKSGNIIGRSSASTRIMDGNGKQTAVQMPFGTALMSDSSWVGGLMPTGVVVDDNGETLGVIAADGVVLDKGNSVIARVLSDGTAVTVPDRELYNTMPYAGKTVSLGLPYGYRNAVLGYATVNGDIVDDGYAKKYRILDDGTFIGGGDALSGVVLPFIQAVNHDGQIIGSLNGRGFVVAPNNETVGKIAVNGAVKADEFLIKGALLPQTTVTNNCEVLGVTAHNGQVINARGTVVGYMMPNRTVINGAGDVVGRATRQGIVVSEDGSYLGRVLQDSTVVDLGGVVMGCAQNDGSVLDNAGTKIGHVIERGPVLSMQAEFIGRVKSNGSVVDKNGHELGRVKSDGFVIDGEGTVLGYVLPRDREILYNEDGTIKGSLDLNGMFYDLRNKAVFRVDEKGQVFTPDGQPTGITYKDGQFGNNPDLTVLTDENGNAFGIVSGCDVFNLNNEKIGTIRPDGSVIDLNGDVFAKILGDGTILKDDKVIGRVSGTNPRLDRCGIQSRRGGVGGFDAEGGDSSSGRAIYIGNERYNVTDKGTIVNSDDVIIGYMGEDGKPYTLDNRPLTASGDATGRSRPNVAKLPKPTPEQIEQIQNLLTQKRSNMRAGIKNSIRPEGRILAQGKRKRSSDWSDMKVGRSVSSWPVDMSRMILQDKAIPAVLVRSVDSRYKDVPVTAIVERHIYSEQGRNIIIPAGSRVIGKMTGSPGTNKVAKMEITWTRLIRPDGGMFTFEAVSGDAQGRGGVAAYLDDQLITKYGKPVMTSIVTSAVSYMMAANDDYTVNADTGTTTQSAKSEAAADARENFINAMDAIFQQLISESTNVPPVVFVPSGTRVTIFSNEDLWLRSEEDDVRDYEESNGPQSKEAQTSPMDSWVDGRTGTKSTDDKKKETDGKKSSESVEVVDYYKPDDSYKDRPVSQEGDDELPVYDGSQDYVTEDIPLQDRKTAPVLPKTGSAGRLF